jgi:hypothetical protein
MNFFPLPDGGHRFLHWMHAGSGKRKTRKAMRRRNASKPVWKLFLSAHVVSVRLQCWPKSRNFEFEITEVSFSIQGWEGWSLFDDSHFAFVWLTANFHKSVTNKINNLSPGASPAWQDGLLRGKSNPSLRRGWQDPPLARHAALSFVSLTCHSLRKFREFLCIVSKCLYPLNTESKLYIYIIKNWRNIE